MLRIITLVIFWFKNDKNLNSVQFKQVKILILNTLCKNFSIKYYQRNCKVFVIFKQYRKTPPGITENKKKISPISEQY